MILSASFICADLLNLERDLKILETNKIDYLHMDISDGEYLPRFGISNPTVKAIRKISKLPMDFHMKVINPEKKVEFFDIRPGDIVVFHLETIDKDALTSACKKLHEKGVKAGVAIYPTTPVSGFADALPYLWTILLLAQTPDRKPCAEIAEKIKETKDYLKLHKCKDIVIGVDGKVTFDTAKTMQKQGVGLIVCGSNSIFNENGIANNIKKLREILA